jgi:hypothetical protein
MHVGHERTAGHSSSPDTRLRINRGMISPKWLRTRAGEAAPQIADLEDGGQTAAVVRVDGTAGGKERTGPRRARCPAEEGLGLGKLGYTSRLSPGPRAMAADQRPIMGPDALAAGGPAAGRRGARLRMLGAAHGSLAQGHRGFGPSTFVGVSSLAG